MGTRAARTWAGAPLPVALVALLLGLALVCTAAQPVDTVEDSVPPVAAARPVPSTVPDPVAPAPLPTPVIVDPDAAVRDVLDRRAAAVRNRDMAGFLDGIDPAAPAEFRDAQAALFANLADVPLARWEYDLRASRIGSSVPTVVRDDLGVAAAQDAWAPRVSLRYALAGVDVVPTERPMGYVFVRREQRWYLASDTALADRPTWRGPWDHGPCVVVRSTRGLVLGHPDDERLLAAIAAEIDAAVDGVSAVWGQDWSRRVAVLVPATTDEFRDAVGERFATEAIAAVAVSDRVDRDAGSVAGARVVFNPVGVDRLSPAARRVVLRHEITHVAARADTVDGAPLWMLEGFADYVGYRDSGISPADGAPDLAADVRANGPPRRLPSDSDFATDSDRLDLSYQQSWTLARYIVSLVGEQGLLALYRRIAVISGDQQTVAARTDDALRAELGIGIEDLVRGWGEDLVRTVG